MNIEHGTFTPLVFSVSGSVGKECFMLHERMTQKIANKTGEQYDKIISIIRSTIYFLILPFCSTCIRGDRSL